MMETMRNLASGFIAKILMGLLVLSFAVWGIADMFSNYGSGAVAKVGKTEIDARNYQSELILEINALSNRLGQRLTAEQTQAFGLPNQVLGRMINEATLNDLAREFNLGLSREELAKSIADEKAFQSMGRFDRNQMNLVLRNAGTTEDRYIENLQALEERQQLAAGLTGNSTVPEATLKVFNAFSFEIRDINYLALKEDAIGEIEDPDEETLTSYFDKQKAVFRAPEYRSFTMLKLEPGDIMDVTAVSDEDAKIYYETASKRFIQPEKRRMQQILFDSEEAAKAAADQIADGASYEDIMAERNLSEDDVDFGLLERDEVSDPAAAEALYSLDEGDVSDVIKGRFGYIIVRNAETRPEQASPFEEIKDQLKAEIAAQRAQDEVLSMYDSVEDERAAGSTLPEISQKLSLPLRTVTAISNAGELESGESVTDLPQQKDLLTAVFDSDVDVEADPIDIGNTGFAWYNVTDIIPSRERKLDEVRDDVVAAWKAAERTNRNAALANEILDELEGGKDMQALAEERGLSMESASGISRQGTGDLPAPVVQELFAGPQGHMGIARNAATQYVLEVANVTEPDFDADSLQLASIKQSLETNASADLLNQLSATVLNKIGFQINESVMQQVINTAR